MQIELLREKGICRVTSEKGDKRVSGGNVNAAGESQLLHRIKRALNRVGCNLIKKRMWKDGHMVDDMQQYLRSRNTKGETWAIYNGHWALRGADEALNEFGTVDLVLVRL